MTYQIDQSGKIEQTNKVTVLCLSNNRQDIVIIAAKTKRQIQEVFRRNGQNKNFVLFTFAAGLSVLIKRNSTLQTVTIDREYYGKESIIKNIVQKMLGGKKRPHIHFDLIGKKSPAHVLSLAVTRGTIQAHAEISLKQLFEAIKKTEVLRTEERLSGGWFSGKRSLHFSGAASTRSLMSIPHRKEKSRRRKR